MEPLVDPVKAAAALGLGQGGYSASPDDLFTRALIAAQVRAEAELRTKLESASGIEDEFLLDADAHSGVVPDGYFRLYLSRGFVRPGSLTTDGASGIRVALDKGIVYVPEAQAGQRVVVKYNAGFNRSGTDLPFWLEDAIIRMTPLLFSGSATGTEKDAREAYKLSFESAMSVLVANRRPTAFTIRPMFEQ